MSVTFADLGVPADLVAALAKRDITTPFPVQAAAIPDLLTGRDVCGCAATGSGKTLAFGIPMLARVQRAGSKRPHALVLAPTRELAAQIEKDLAPLAAARGLRVLAVYGGVSLDNQRRQLVRGVDILVACPGRLGDLLRQRAVRLDGIEIVVIDEADRLADMGFLPDVRKLLDLTPAERQTVLFSATLDGDVAVLTRQYQRDVARHDVSGSQEAAGDVDHRFWRVEQHEQHAYTAEVIANAGPTIVFCRTRHRADRVAKQLANSGVSTAAIHGGRTQGQRTRALEAFSSGSVQALVATDVAARGIHVDSVACVVHFDLPADAKTYIHRSGRTARAGASGLVVSLVGREQVGAARKLQKEVGVGGQLGTPDAGSIATASPSKPSSGKPSPSKPNAGRSNSGRPNAGRSNPGAPNAGAPKRGPHADRNRGRRARRGAQGSGSGTAKTAG